MNRAYYFVLTLAFAFAVMFCTGIVSAQVTTGTPPFGSFGGGPDIINLANLNSHITVPILHKAGRGTDFTYDLSHDTSVWYPVGVSGSQTWQPVYNWGWRAVTEIATGYVSRNVASFASCFCGPRQPCGFTTTTSAWKYHDPWGIPHNFAGGTTVHSGSSPCPNSSTSLTVTATDGSGYTLNATGTLLGSITSRDGKVLHPPINGGIGAATNIDRNGNEISADSSGHFTDTLGTTALTVAGSGTPASPMTFTYTAPSGALPAYTMKFTAYTVQTKFGCSVADYGPISNNLISEIDLPDGSNYAFTYEGTPGVPGNVTGRLASVTLPTGGTITYAYTGGSNGINCADGSAATLTRTTPDGIWKYAQVKGTGAASTTTITDPQNNVTTIQFQGIYETQRVVNQGSSTTLVTTNTCYNLAVSPCNGTAITLPITNWAVITTLPNNSISKHVESFSTFGMPTEIDDYDYPSGTALLQKTTITYASLTNINAFSQTTTVFNGAGTQIAQTTNNYDETAVVTNTGTPPQHVAVSGSRGNLTSIHYPAGGLTSHLTYYDTGTVNTATDVNGAVTTFNYPDVMSTCGYAFSTSASEPLGLSRSMTWDCRGGVQLTATDENSKTVTTTYNDANFWRPNAVADQASNTTNIGYGVGGKYVTPYMFFNGNNSIAAVARNFDGLGRAAFDQQYQSPTSTTYDTASYTFDGNGRPYSTSLPCSVGAGLNCPSGTPKTTQTYDALNRPLVTTDGGGGTVSYSPYTGNDVLVTIGAPAKSRQLEYDALGRLTSVCEITSATGSGACGQNVAQNGFLTKYTFDALNNLLTVTQNAQPGGTPQSRSFQYDAMSRLISETNPESGTTSYSFDSTTGTTCALSSPGDMIKRVDANGNWTCYNYDSFHRLTDVGNNIQNAANPVKQFRYDNWAGLPGSTKPSGLTNTLGRLVEVATASGSLITDEWFSYTARGEVSDVYQSSPHSGGYYHVSEAYWANGAPNTLGSNILGLPTFTYGVDGEGRTNTVSASSGQNPVTATSYNVASLPTAVTYGSLDSDSFTFDANTNRMTQYQFSVNGSSLTGILGWNANGTLGTQNITNAFNAAGTQNCTYGHDDLMRITNANCGTAAAQTFSFDAFGNLNKVGSPFSFTPTYSSATNRMTAIGSFTPTYDNNGNVLNDNLHTFSWDVYGRPTTIVSVGVTYDALGRAVEQNRSGVFKSLVYAPTGEKLALVAGQGTVQWAFVPLPGGGRAIYLNGALGFYRHADWLGSDRLDSTPTRTVRMSEAYAPFGEPYTSSGSTDVAFTGQNQDTLAGLDDFPAREYSYQGRWASPDPAGLAAVDPTNPQSWNRYAYVMNNPLNLVDPSGLGPRHGHPRIPPRQGIDCTNTQTSMSGSGPDTCNGATCTLNGVDTSCVTVVQLIQAGATTSSINGSVIITTTVNYSLDPDLCIPNPNLCTTINLVDIGGDSSSNNSGTTIKPSPKITFRPPSISNFVTVFLPCYGGQVLGNFFGDKGKAAVTFGTIALTVKNPVLGGVLLVTWTGINTFKAGAACAFASRAVYQ